jgi:cyclophilin family peptidyl-prolyl cis-trans isomerase
MSWQGTDAGDGQFFIDLVDQPAFDHGYTIFARVKSGMNLVDRLLDGAKIVGVTVK